MKLQKVILEAIPASSPERMPLVMIIDDSLTVRTIIQVGLRRKGMQVLGFTDGVAALCWLMTSQARVPDLIILDIGLPKMDGFEVARRLKARPQLQTIPIIMLTRRAGLLDRLKGRIAGACVYMIKPFRMEEVAMQVMTLLDV